MISEHNATYLDDAAAAAAAAVDDNNALAKKFFFDIFSEKNLIVILRCFSVKIEKRKTEFTICFSLYCFLNMTNFVFIFAFSII